MLSPYQLGFLTGVAACLLPVLGALALHAVDRWAVRMERRAQQAQDRPAPRVIRLDGRSVVRARDGAGL